MPDKTELQGPYSRTELIGFWSALVLVPACAYAILRVLAWIVRGFRRQA